MTDASPRILLVYDGSSVADRALSVAVERALERHAVLTILCVLPPRMWRAKRGQFDLPPDKHDEGFAKEQVDRARGTCAQSGVRCEGRIRTGSPAAVISEEAAEHELLIVGSRPSATGAPLLAELVKLPDGCELLAVP